MAHEATEPNHPPEATGALADGRRGMLLIVETGMLLIAWIGFVCCGGSEGLAAFFGL